MSKIDNHNKLVESPCIRHCCLDESDVCLGCHRSLDEIKLWGNSNPETKRGILDNAEQRRKYTSRSGFRF